MVLPTHYPIIGCDEPMGVMTHAVNEARRLDAICSQCLSRLLSLWLSNFPRALSKVK